MLSKLKTALAAAAIPAAALVTGCGQSAVNTNTAPKGETAPVSLTLITKGQFFPWKLQDGMYKMTIPADKFGTPNDVPCVLIAQTTGGNSAIGTVSCDWVAAHAPK